MDAPRHESPSIYGGPPRFWPPRFSRKDVDALDAHALGEPPEPSNRKARRIKDAVARRKPRKSR